MNVRTPNAKPSLGGPGTTEKVDFNVPSLEKFNPGDKGVTEAKKTGKKEVEDEYIELNDPRFS